MKDATCSTQPVESKLAIQLVNAPPEQRDRIADGMKGGAGCTSVACALYPYCPFK